MATRFRPVRLLCIVGLSLTVLACAVREHRPAGAWLDEREAWFATHPVWSVNGRVALRDGERGGSLAFDWQANGDSHRIMLRTVTGGRQWLLEFEPGHAELQGTDVGHIAGPDPDQLVEHAVGWPIPVGALSDWIRGLPGSGHARVDFAADGTISRINQAPWELVYQRFDMVGGQLMPARLEAESEPYRVRVVLRAWEWHTDTAGAVARDVAMPL